MIRQTKLCVVLLALALGWHGLPERVFAWDYTQSTNFGVLSPGDHVHFKVTPPKNAQGKDAIVTKGTCDQPGGFIWIGGPASWNGTVPPDFAAQHIGRFSGEYCYPGTGGVGKALTWKMDTAGEVVKLETITDATIPADRTRRTLGVGEKVTLTLKGATGNQVTWSLSSGSGSIYPPSGSSTKFTAHERASGASVMATYKDKTYTANFSVIEPEVGIVIKYPNMGIYHEGPNLSSVGFKGYFHVLPNSVSFYNIAIREGNGVAVASGIYSNLNGRIHLTGPWLTVIESNDVQCEDTIYSGTYYPPFIYGEMIWPIEWKYHVIDSTNIFVFTTVNHHQISDETKAQIEKGGAGPFIKNHSDPYSSY